MVEERAKTLASYLSDNTVHIVVLQFNGAAVRGPRRQGDLVREGTMPVASIQMKALPVVVNAEYQGDFRIRLVFNDATEGAVDFSDP